MLEVKYPNFEYLQYSGKDQKLYDLLSGDFEIQEEDIEDIFSSTQLSKVEERKEYLYFAIQLPTYHNEFDYIQIKQIHCLVSPKYLFVIDESHYRGLDEFKELRTDLTEKGVATSFDLFYEIFDVSVVRMFRILYRLQRDIKDIEGIIFEGETEEDQIRDIQTVKKNIVNFKSLISPLEDLVEEMILQHGKYIDQAGEEDLDDSLDKLKKLANKLDNFRDTMALLTETNELLIARSTNKTIKVLTVVNLFLLFPSIIAGFFGMNVYFGWDLEQKSYGPLIGILIGGTLAVIAGFLFFKKKKYI